MKNIHAAELGKLGGRVRSLKKSQASRSNGHMGGRPAKNGVANWVLFFDAVDSCRRLKNFNKLFALFSSRVSPREKSLLNATARCLAEELYLEVPSWAANPLQLKDPFFVSGMENLKALALVESPPHFRMNHIFVLENFLVRV